MTDEFDNIVFDSPYSDIAELENSAQLDVYPNPSNGIVHVDFVSDNNDVATLELFDSKGKLINVYDVQQVIGNNSITLDLRDDIVGINNAQIVYLVLERNGMKYVRKISLY